MKKITFTLSYMTERSVLTWIDTFYEKAISGAIVTLGTWNDFPTTFQATFKYQDIARNTISWLSTHHMTKKNRKFSLSLKSYISTFQSNVACAGITDYNVLISFFTARIHTLLMNQIMSLSTIPSKINKWYTKTTHFQNQWDHVDQIAPT